MPYIPLCDLIPGEWGMVKQLNTIGSMRRRLLDLGLTPDTPVVCLGHAPGGDPTGYGIRQAVIALRRQDAATVIVYVAKGVDADGADQTCHRTGCH